MTTVEQTKFRRTKAWKSWREYMKSVQGGKCYITGSKLRKTSQLHHLDPKHYDLLEQERFVFLLSSRHDVIHAIYRYYRKDKTVIDRITEVLEKMYQYEIEGEEYDE